MEGITGKLHGGQLRIRYLYALGIFAFIEFGAHGEPGCGGGSRNQLHDGFEAAQRLVAPIERDEGKQTIFDLVPLTRSRRQMAYRDWKVQFIGQRLQFDLP